MWSPFHHKEHTTDIVPGKEANPFHALRRRMDDLLDDFAGGAGWPFADGREDAAPRIDVSETDKEVTVEAELPGVDEKDLDLSLADDVLTIKGEKKREREEKKELYQLTERSYGRFHRSMRLPFEPDPKKVKATFKAGVLTVTVPKPPEVKAKAKKIAIGNGK
jgi:HSP20 family protein